MGGYGACFNRDTGELIYNVGRLGWAYFEKPPVREEHLALLIHEFGHGLSSDHLSKEYHDGICKLGAKLAMLLKNDPGYLARA
jgi:hypothetical protein